MTIKTRISFVVSPNYDEDLFMGWVGLQQVPDVGELINVEGKPYTVLARGWAVQTTFSTPNAIPAHDQYCHLTVTATKI